MSEPKDKATVPSVDDVVLLPCPCCGGSANSGCYDEGGGDEWWVECSKCELMLGNRKSEQDARSAWNMRVSLNAKQIEKPRSTGIGFVAPWF